MSVIPFVVERDGNSERSYDIYSRLLKDRIVFIGDVISAQTASLVVAQLLFLEGQDSRRDINMYIHSPGGSVSAGLAIYDTMQFIKPAISTFCMGSAASMASVLLAAGTKGKRSILPPCQGHDPPAHGRCQGPVLGHTDRGQGDTEDPGTDGRHTFPAHRSAGGKDQPRQRPQFLDEC